MSDQHATRTKPDSFLNDDFKEYVESLLAKDHVPGFSIAVIDGDQVESSGYGFARLPNSPATPDTLYCMGSTTKAFTANLTGQLIHESSKQDKKTSDPKLNWSTPISKVLGLDFETSDLYIDGHASLEDALSHRTGVPGHDLLWGPHMTDTSEITRLQRYLGPVSAPFRGKFQYNNMMYTVVANAIERLAGKGFDNLLRERILEPLGMQSTFSGVGTASKAFEERPELDFARGYYWLAAADSSDDGHDEDAGGEKAGHYVSESFIDLAANVPAGGNMSSVKDYAKWVQAWLRAAKLAKDASDSKEKDPAGGDDSAVVTSSIFKQMTTPRSMMLPTPPSTWNVYPEFPDLTPLTYGLGWFIDPHVAPGVQVVQHGGGLPGFGAHVVFVPAHDFGIVCVGNTSEGSNKVCEIVARELIGKKLGRSKEERRKMPDKKDEKKGEEKEETSTKDVPEAKTSDVADAVEPSQEDLDITGIWTQPAYGEIEISHNSASAALDAETPELEGDMIERKKEHRKERGKATEPYLIKPVLPRGLNWALLMHSPRKFTESTLCIYDLELLLCHGDLRPDAFSQVKQEFPAGCEADEKYPFKNMRVWQSQKIDKRGAVVEVNSEGKPSRIGLQLARIDVAEDTFKGLKEDELEEEWSDRLVWFERSS